MDRARSSAPKKSILAKELRGFVGLANLSSSGTGVEGRVGSGGGIVYLGRYQAQKTIAMMKMGTCPRKDHRHPMVSASQPPRGPPKLRPVVAARLRPACHEAASRMGTRSSRSP